MGITRPQGSGSRPPPLKHYKRVDDFRPKKEEKTSVLVVHDNRNGEHTERAHELIKDLKKDPHYRVISDKETFKPGEKPSKTEINKREAGMVREADFTIRVVPSPSKTGQSRHMGAIHEVRKTIHAGKPLLEIFERRGRNSPNRNISELNYGKRVQVRMEEGQHLKTAVREGMELLRDKKIIQLKYIPFENN